jgi:hypothetical protein
LKQKIILDLRNDILGRLLQSPDVCKNNSEIEIENGWVLVFRNISCNSHMGCRFAPTHNSAVVRGFAEHHTDVLIETIETKNNFGLIE